MEVEALRPADDVDAPVSLDFEDWVEARAGSLMSFAYVVTGDRDAAQEALQEALASALGHGLASCAPMTLRRTCGEWWSTLISPDGAGFAVARHRLVTYTTGWAGPILVARTQTGWPPGWTPAALTSCS